MSLIGLLTATEKQVHLGRLVAVETKQLKGTRDTRKGDPHSHVTPSTSEMVAGGRQCTRRSTTIPTKTCSANLYRRIKGRRGHLIKRAHCKERLAPSRNQTTHKLSATKSGLSGCKRVPGPLLKQHSPHCYRLHNSGCIQGGRDVV